MDGVKGRVHKNQCEQGFHIIGGHTFSLLQLDGLGLLHEVLGVPNMMEEPSISGQKMLANSLAKP